MKEQRPSVSVNTRYQQGQTERPFQQSFLPVSGIRSDESADTPSRHGASTPGAPEGSRCPSSDGRETLLGFFRLLMEVDRRIRTQNNTKAPESDPYHDNQRQET